jgi:hypothetical protein
MRPNGTRNFWMLTLAAAMVVGGVSTSEAQSRRSGSKSEFSTGFDDPVVTMINEHIRQGWTDNEVEPSEVADDAEWLRRVYLDLAGHIPSAEEVDAFLNDKNAAKRSDVIRRLLEDEAYAHNFTNVWTNLAIGRQTPQRTSREGMRKFFREAFTRNRPWNDVVYDLLTADGHYEENGAVNFLLAQLMGNPNSDDYTVEATARATRLLLGTQVQCTQCHNHPFNDWKQAQFWEFDSFLKQIRRVDHRKFDPESGREVDDYSELVWRNYSGPVYYEQRSGVMEVAYPKYADQEFESGGEVDRREVLAKVLAKDDPNHQVARAFVNRMWEHFFGVGFTKPVDDMGPHNPPSHPDLLDKLTAEFVKADYNPKTLAQWITNSLPYNLTSKYNSSNTIDDPSAGEVPLFSHLYVKPLTAEQLYDSLLVATQADQAGAGGYAEAQARRERFLREFLLIFGGNAEDEPSLFSGTIPQALMMMNGPLVQSAISSDKGSYLSKVLWSDALKTDNDRIRYLYLSALGRNPSSPELKASQSMLRSYRDKETAYQDIYWALLNSNEFVFNH